MRLLFVGHLGSAHDDEILFAKPVRVQRFSVVPHSTLAHDVIATTQQEPFEFELSFQKKDAKELSQIHKGPVSRGGTCDVKGASSPRSSRSEETTTASVWRCMAS